MIEREVHNFKPKVSVIVKVNLLQDCHCFLSKGLKKEIEHLFGFTIRFNFNIRFILKPVSVTNYFTPKLTENKKHGIKNWVYNRSLLNYTVLILFLAYMRLDIKEMESSSASITELRSLA